MSEARESPREEKTEGRKFKPGDIVRLKSGGPMMTVAFIDHEYEQIECGWFAKLNRMSASFAVAELARVDDDYVHSVLQARNRIAEPANKP